ncbi:MAG TPA: aminotransferase class I/II-fold pyridoxal phosphate-dependent enzyme [Lachnospiraceae bacterium]|jgi:DNA-binding transcriptional MocR family regulator|nr:aminotransferase class I/II-fold pyridoxal phosphate-dependent enzyme [Lachnospiraceae bacterium]
MKKYTEMSETELKEQLAVLTKEYEAAKAKGLKLDMSRGKPSPAQLDVSNEMLDIVNSETGCVSDSGTDCRNYGIMEGIPEARQLMGDFLRVPKENVFVCGNASLNIMYDCVSSAMLFGIMGSTPWCHLDKVKFLCPVPGYDRHFKITELMGIEMINIPMTENGPDMDMVEKLVSSDSSIKGIWCVPKYSNPQGIVYSDETVKRFAALKPAAKDFRIYWDNAYALHYIYDENIEIPEILSECAKAGNPDLVYEFCSTSKISFAGGGISAIASSEANLKWISKRMNVETISYDKINQLRHARYFKNGDGLRAHMRKHAEFLRPKFDVVLETLDRELTGLGAGSWMKPMGGYFISFDAVPGCAKAIVNKCKEAGVVLTGAGATYPYGKDPDDSNIRIAPSYPTLEELKQAAELFTLCAKLATVEKLLA